MCTICGFGLLKGHKIRNDKAMRKLISRLIMKNTGFNTSATGVAFGCEEEVRVVKQNIPGGRFVESSNYLNAGIRRVVLPMPSHPDIINTRPWPGDLSTVLGHCRLKTKGEATNNANNHPIICSNVVGIHNGVIYNDDILFDKFGKELVRIGEVDSEIIFSLIDYYSRNTDVDQAIKIALEDIQGSLACAMLHREFPHSIWLFRRTSPCEVYIYKEVGLIGWSTNGNNLKGAVLEIEREEKDFLLGPETEIDFPRNTGMRIDLDTHKLREFEVEGRVFTRSGGAF